MQEAHSMKIDVVSIAKPEKDCYSQLCDHFIKMSKRYAQLEARDLFTAKVTKAQENGPASAQKIYAELFGPWMERGYTVALDPRGEQMVSETFAQLFVNHSRTTFFIGGAYGHSKEFLQSCDRVVSLSKLTMSHKIAKVVLFEQIYRGLTILEGHPYHK